MAIPRLNPQKTKTIYEVGEKLERKLMREKLEQQLMEEPCSP